MNNNPFVEDWEWKFFNLDDEGKKEMIEHMKVEPLFIISYSFIMKLLLYPIFWIRQYKVTCKYWNKPVKHRWFWRVYYTFSWCNLLIFSKVSK